MKCRGLLAVLWAFGAQSLCAQQLPQKSDTVVVGLTPSSNVTLTIGDPADLETLKNYNFQALFKDIIDKLERRDTSALPGVAGHEPETTPDQDIEDWNDLPVDSPFPESTEDDNEDWNEHKYRRGRLRTRQSFNIDLGTNNYLEGGRFPNDNNASYAVRPWGSWYVGLASIQRTRLARKFFLEWGAGVNWYNFKFEKDNILIKKEDDRTHFIDDVRYDRYIKSKLEVMYITASLVPVIDFSDNSQKSRFWEGYSNSFRIGLGPYVGYRVESHSKLVYNDGGKQKEKDHDSFYLNNLRYGLRLQMGYRGADFFFNYDLNDLFVENKGPQLNAFSFGVIF